VLYGWGELERTEEDVRRRGEGVGEVGKRLLDDSERLSLLLPLSPSSRTLPDHGAGTDGASAQKRMPFLPSTPPPPPPAYSKQQLFSLLTGTDDSSMGKVAAAAVLSDMASGDPMGRGASRKPRTRGQAPIKKKKVLEKKPESEGDEEVAGPSRKKGKHIYIPPEEYKVTTPPHPLLPPWGPACNARLPSC